MYLLPCAPILQDEAQFPQFVPRLACRSGTGCGSHRTIIPVGGGKLQVGARDNGMQGSETQSRGARQTTS